MMNIPLPEAFAERMRQQLGDAYPFFADALNAEPLRGIRINSMKETLALESLPKEEMIPWGDKAFYLPADSKAGSMMLHEAGAYYLQEPGAMIPAAALAARPGERILDLCAAPGGKATQIGIAMKGQGLLVCNEPIPKRAQVLSRNIERMGLPHAVVTSAWPEQLAEKWPGMFDAVMVDAPCSGEGMFRRDPATRREWTAEKAEGCVSRQREILRAAAALVRPGGRLVYATCTYHPAENELNAAWFMKSFPEFHTVPFSLPGIDAPEGVFTCYPHRLRGEGQFAALFRKEGDPGDAAFRKDTALPAPSKADRLVFEEAFPGLPRATCVLGSTLICAEELPDLSGIRVYRAGLHLGEIRGKAPVPDHAAALSFFPPDLPRKHLDHDQAAAYLGGNTLAGEETGWMLMCYEGLPLGWGKGSGGTIRNHYPKGLRSNRLI